MTVPTTSLHEDLIRHFAEILGPMTSASKLGQLAEVAAETCQRWAADEPTTSQSRPSEAPSD